MSQVLCVRKTKMSRVCSVTDLMESETGCCVSVGVWRGCRGLYLGTGGVGLLVRYEDLGGGAVQENILSQHLSHSDASAWRTAVPHAGLTYTALTYYTRGSLHSWPERTWVRRNALSPLNMDSSSEHFCKQFLTIFFYIYHIIYISNCNLYTHTHTHQAFFTGKENTFPLEHGFHSLSATALWMFLIVNFHLYHIMH